MRQIPAGRRLYSRLYTRISECLHGEVVSLLVKRRRLSRLVPAQLSFVFEIISSDKSDKSTTTSGADLITIVVARLSYLARLKI